MTRLSVERIELLACEIKAFLEKWYLDCDVSLFYNGIMSEPELCGKKHEWVESKENPEKYCDYVAADHILTMTFDGQLYNFLYSGYEPINTEKLGYDTIIYVYRKLNLKANIEKQICEYMNTIGLDPSEYESNEEYLITKFEMEHEIEKELLKEVISEKEWEITRLAKKEFDSIFDKYGIWYNFGDSWNITCFYY